MFVVTGTNSPQDGACLGTPSLAVSKFYFFLLYYFIFLFWGPRDGTEALLYVKHVPYHLAISAFSLFNTHSLLKLCGLALVYQPQPSSFTNSLLKTNKPGSDWSGWHISQPREEASPHQHFSVPELVS